MLAPFGAGKLCARSHALLPAILSIVIIQLLIYSAWFDFASMLSYGPRYLLQSNYALAFLVAAALEHRGRARVAFGWIALGLGFAASLPGALLLHSFQTYISESFPPFWSNSGVWEAWGILLDQGTSAIICLSGFVPEVAVLALLAGLIGLWFPRGALTAPPPRPAAPTARP